MFGVLNVCRFMHQLQLAQISQHDISLPKLTSLHLILCGCGKQYWCIWTRLQSVYTLIRINPLKRKNKQTYQIQCSEPKRDEVFMFMLVVLTRSNHSFFQLFFIFILYVCFYHDDANGIFMQLCFSLGKCEKNLTFVVCLFLNTLYVFIYIF